MYLFTFFIFFFIFSLIINVFKNGIKKGGCIVIKDNVSTNDKVFYDDEDASWTRPKDQIVDLCKQSGLKMIHDKKQQNFPDDMLPVYMIAFR